MTTEFNELLQDFDDDQAQILIIGSRAKVRHLMNEMCVTRFVRDRVHFTPIIPAPFAPGKFMTVLVR